MNHLPNPRKHKYSKLLLRFYDPLESIYFKDRVGQELSGIRLIFGSLAIINPLFILLDFWRIESPLHSVITRIILEVLFISILLVLRRLKDSILSHQILFFIASIIIYWTLLISTHFSDDSYELFISNSTLLVLFINASFIGLRFRHSIILNLFILLLYFCYANWFSIEQLHIKQLPFIAFFFVISSVLSYLFERKSRAVFLKNEFIEDQNRIIEQKNEELNGQNQLKNSLMSILSHDIKSPLSALEGLLSLKSDGMISEKDAIEHFNKVGKSVNNLSKFVSNVILWIKSQMEGISVKNESIQIKYLIDQIIDLFEDQIRSKGIMIKNEFYDDFLIHLDREMISIIIRNLISNAIKFSKSNSVITICPSEGNEIQIIDEGVGIEKNKLETLFEMKPQTSSLGTNKEEGTGLGLLLSYNLIRKMGGELKCKSEFGKGTVFTITLP